MSIAKRIMEAIDRLAEGKAEAALIPAKALDRDCSKVSTFSVRTDVSVVGGQILFELREHLRPCLQVSVPGHLVRKALLNQSHLGPSIVSTILAARL